MTVSDFRNALGECKDDSLELANRWARVVIARAEDDSWPGYPNVYVVFGDCERREFGSLSRALAYALRELADFKCASWRVGEANPPLPTA